MAEPTPAETAGREHKASQRVYRNTGYMMVNSALTLAFGVAVTVILARGLGPRLLGIYATLTALTGILAILVDFGSDMTLTRQAARDHRRVKQLAAAAGLAKILFTFWPATLVLVFFPLLQGYDDRQTRLAFGVGLLVLALEGIWSVFSASLKGLERMGPVARINVAGAALQAAAALSIFVVPWPLAAAAAALAASAGLRALLGWYSFRRAVAETAPLAAHQPLIGEIRSLAPAAAIFFLTSVVFTLHDRLDIVLVSMISGAEEAGYYGIASRFTAWLSILPGAMVAALYPYLSRRPDRDPATFRRLRLAAVIYGTAAALAALTLGRPLIRLVLGDDYAPAWGPMALRAWVLPLMMFAHFLAIRLYSQGRERQVAWRTAAGLLVNLAANLVLIPLYGGMGAAVAAVASGLTVTFLLWQLGRGSPK